MGAVTPNKITSLLIESWSDEQIRRFKANSLLQRQKNWLTQTFTLKRHHKAESDNNQKSTSGFFKKRKLKKEKMKNAALNEEDPFRKKLIQTLLDDPWNKNN